MLVSGAIVRFLSFFLSVVVVAVFTYFCYHVYWWIKMYIYQCHSEWNLSSLCWLVYKALNDLAPRYLSGYWVNKNKCLVTVVALCINFLTYLFTYLLLSAPAASAKRLGNYSVQVGIGSSASKAGNRPFLWTLIPRSPKLHQADSARATPTGM